MRGKYIKTGEKPREIVTANGDHHVAGKGQFFQESERGQAWELWQGGGLPMLIKRFPKRRVMIVAR